MSRDVRHNETALQRQGDASGTLLRHKRGIVDVDLDGLLNGANVLL